MRGAKFKSGHKILCPRLFSGRHITFDVYRTSSFLTAVHKLRVKCKKHEKRIEKKLAASVKEIHRKNEIAYAYNYARRHSFVATWLQQHQDYFGNDDGELFSPVQSSVISGTQQDDAPFTINGNERFSVTIIEHQNNAPDNSQQSQDEFTSNGNE